MRLLIGLLLCLSLTARADDWLSDAATSPDTFAVCKGVDIASTAYIIHTGIGHEANPLMRALLSHGYFPMIAFGAGIWWWLDQVDNPEATLSANAVTCGVAAHNVLLILQ